jgi:hypothetical protein
MSPIDPASMEDDGDGDLPAAPRARRASAARATTARVDASRAENRLAEVLRELHDRRDEVVDEIRRIRSTSPRVVVGVSICVVLIGGLALWMRSRRRSRGPRRPSATRRIATELGKEIAGRALTTAASVVAAHLTEDVLLPMVRERLAERLERTR